MKSKRNEEFEGWKIEERKTTKLKKGNITREKCFKYKKTGRAREKKIENIEKQKVQEK